MKPEVSNRLNTMGGEDTLLVVFKEKADKSQFIKNLTGEDKLPVE